MKRGFVYGIGSYFALVAIWFPTQPDARAGLIRFEGLALAFEAVPVLVAGLAFYAAVHAPPRRTW
jgi:hypothetical protein